MHRIIICGSRNFTDFNMLTQYLDNKFANKDKSQITIVSGHARGTDMLAESYAHMRNIHLREFPAKWNTLGKSAGMVRNKDMLNYITQPGHTPEVIAFWDGISRGTENMIQIAKKANVPVDICHFTI